MLETIDTLRRSNVRLLVLGDVILDQYTFCEAERVSPEAPVLVLRSDYRENRLGGASFVASVLRALGVRTTVAGVVGDDANGEEVRWLLEEPGADFSLLLKDEQRPTTTKERFLGGSEHREAQQILRVDHESREDLSWELQGQLIELLHGAIPEHDAVLVSDYAKGVCTPRVLREAIVVARLHSVPVIIDPARGVDYRHYRGATLLVPNRIEAEAATGVSILAPQDACEAGKKLCGLCDLNAAVVKLDRDGMALVQWDKPCTIVPALAKATVDVTGAGDIVLALLGLCQPVGVERTTAVALANAAAGVEVRKVGASPLTWREIYEAVEGPAVPAHRKIITIADLPALSASHRQQGKTIVFSNGCFDLLHVGHVTHLQEASRLGDVLVVAINSDRSIEQLKGPGRPLIPEEDRAHMLAALECVDHVLVFDADTPHEVLRQLRPDVLAKGGTTHDVVAREVVDEYGGSVRTTPTVSGVSTTRLLHEINQQSAIREVHCAAS